MAGPLSYAYPSPLAGYENAPPLPDEIAKDGKSYINPPSATGKSSESYSKFTEPLANGTRGGL